MREHGFADARCTPVGKDNGIDIESRRAVAQVKAYMKPIGSPAIRDLMGTAVAEGKLPLFFSLSGFSPDALKWADRPSTGVALYQFDYAGDITPVNQAARQVVNEHRAAVERRLAAERQAEAERRAAERRADEARRAADEERKRIDRDRAEQRAREEHQRQQEQLQRQAEASRRTRESDQRKAEQRVRKAERRQMASDARAARRAQRRSTYDAAPGSKPLTYWAFAVSLIGIGCPVLLTSMAGWLLCLRARRRITAAGDHKSPLMLRVATVLATTGVLLSVLAAAGFASNPDGDSTVSGPIAGLGWMACLATGSFMVFWWHRTSTKAHS